MIALITAALEGLASLKTLFAYLQQLNLDNRLQKLEAQQQQMNAAFVSLASSNTPEEMKSALKDITDSWNK